ncbi:MAG: hypothetical protein KDB00_13375 [Planctomycetales bacterium]|nr:hypothetical protein [Planctomycetales bacterium]
MDTNVNLGQLVYTSCRKGLGNGPGLQTQAISPSVTTTQREEAESLSGYDPPELPVHASKAELNELCPVAFRYTKFESGRSAFSRLTYVGADYSGRHGNFIAHSLLVPIEDLNSYPIDWLRYPGWVDTVSDDPPQLDDICLSDIAKESLTFTQLAKFIESRPEFVQQLPSILHAVILSRIENRPVVIADDAANAANWIAALTKLFPPNVSPAIEFSTFSNSLSASYDIQCTTGNSDFDLSDSVSQREAYVFDFISQKYSSLPQQPDSYATNAADAFLHQPESLNSFIEFAADLDRRIGRDELETLFACYKSLYIGVSDVTPSVVRTAIELAVQGRFDQADIVDRVIRGIDRANESYSSEHRVSVAECLVENVGKLASDARAELSDCVERMLWSELKSTSGCWTQLDASLCAIRGTAPTPFTDGQISDLANLVSMSIENGTAPLVLQFISGRLKRCGIADPWLHENFLEIAAGTVDRVGFKNVVASIFECLQGSDSDVCASLCVELSGDRFPPGSVRQVGIALSGLLDRSNAKRRSAIRAELLNRKAFHILLAESDYRRRSADKHIGEFLTYLQELEGSIDTEFSEEIGEVLRCVWQDAEPDSKTEIAAWVIKRQSRFQRLNQTTRDQVMAHLDPIISLHPVDRDKRELAEAMDKIASALGHMPPPHSRVRTFLHNSGAFDSVSEATTAWKAIDVELESKHYSSVATSLLQALIPKSTSAEEHWKTLVWCKNVCDQDSMFDSYKAYVRSRAMVNLPQAAATAFALAAIGCDSEHATGESETAFAESELNGWLKNLSNQMFQIVSDSVASDLENDDTRLGDWKVRCSGIQQSRGKLLPRLTRALGIRW